MKRLGFTLAEVLITLGIIGVVSAVTLPTLMSNSQYKQLGVKLSKFHSTLENAALAEVAANGEFPDNNKDLHAIDFINNTFIFKETYNGSGTKTSDNKLDLLLTTCQTNNFATNYGVLKDGTMLQANTSTNEDWDRDKYPTGKYGMSALKVVFGPNVKGLPSDARKFYTFYVTKKGYVFPGSSVYDPCITEIFDNDFNVKSTWYKNKGVCTTSSYS